MSLKIKRDTIIAFFLYHAIFINIKYLNVYTYIEQACILLSFLFIVPDFLMKVRCKSIRKYKYINSCVLAFCVSIFISGILNRNTTTNNTLAMSILYVMSILNIFFGFELFEARKNMRHVLCVFYRLTVFYIIINDFLMLFINRLYVQFGELYLIGNKFSVVITHLFLYALYKTVKKDKKINRIIANVLLLMATVVAIYTNCMTGLVGCLVIFVIEIIPDARKKKIVSPWVVAILLCFFSTILIVYSEILSLPIMQDLINNILHKEGTIASRLFIYTHVFEVINRKIYWGYGYNNSYPILTKLGIGVNTQNGVLENLMYFGSIGTAFLILLLCATVGEMKRENTKKAYPFFMLVIVFIVASSVEIMLGIKFILCLGIINSICFSEEKIGEIG